MDNKLKLKVLGIVFFAGMFTPLNGNTDSKIDSLLSPEGKLLFGNEPNSIMIIDHPENISRVEDYLDMIDVPPRQVLIEARVVEVGLGGEHSLGINWEAFADKGGLEIGQFRVGSTKGGGIVQEIPYKSTVYPPLQTTSQEESPFTLTIFDDNITTVVNMLANSFDTNLLSAPRVTTVNNNSAEIKVIERLPWAEPEVDVSDEGIAVTWDINFEEVGIILEVTPTITEDGKISMELKPEVSEKVEDYAFTVIQDDVEVPYTVPVIDTRYADTRVVIGDRQTLIIGGLIKERNTEGTTKIPLLGDIPGLGLMFRSRKNTREKTELLIFVSPMIITPEVMARMEKEERTEVGEWYMKERMERQERLDGEEVNFGDIFGQINRLEEKVNELVKERKRIERKIKGR